jgi:transcription initiation factor IIF auxiliary subunit
MDWGALITGALGGITAFVPVILLYRANRRKIESEAAVNEASARDKASETADRTLEGAFKLIEKLESDRCDDLKRLDQLEADNRNFKRRLEKALMRIEVLMQGIKTLLAQLYEANIEPNWEPGDWRDE